MKKKVGIRRFAWRSRSFWSVWLSLALVIQMWTTGAAAAYAQNGDSTASAAAAAEATRVNDDDSATFVLPVGKLDISANGSFNGWGTASVAQSVYVSDANLPYIRIDELTPGGEYEYKLLVGGNWMDGDNLTATADAQGTLLLPFEARVAGSFDPDWNPKRQMTLTGGVFRYTTDALPEGTYEYKYMIRAAYPDGSSQDIYFNDPTSTLLASNGNNKLTVGEPDGSPIADTFEEQPGGGAKWVIAGSFQQGLGESGNWVPNGTATRLKHLAGEFYAYSAVLDAGSYEFKLTKNGSYPSGIPGDGDNLKLTLSETAKVNFYVNGETHEARISPLPEGSTATGIAIYDPALPAAEWPRLVGSPQPLFGEPEWSPGEAKQFFVDYYFNNTVYKLQRSLPAGSHEVKAVLGAEWNDDNNFGDGVNNAVFRLSDAADVTFSFDNSAAERKLTVDFAVGDGKYDGRIDTGAILFDSRSETFKKPFGAIRQGSQDLTLRIAAKRDDVQTARLELTDGAGNSANYPMRKTTTVGDLDYFEVVVPRSAFAGIGIWTYKFVLIDGATKAEYGDDALSGGAGEAVSEGAVPFNLTVYASDYKTPDWMKNAVVYQIFPDRFFDGNEANNRAKLVDGYRGVRSETGANAGILERQPLQYFDGGTENDPAPSQVWGEWSDVPENPDRGKPENAPYYPDAASDGIWTNEFYGGDIQGIEKKLNYLKQLGVTAVYLNPVAWAASNHKYDATDYKHLDPMFGEPVYNVPGDPASGLNYEGTRKKSDEAFRDFAKAAARAGIRIINDGVFNHVGDDSIYFDRYEKYPEIGAYEFWSKVWTTKAEHPGMTAEEAEERTIASFTAQINPATGQNYKYPDDFGFTTWFTIGEETIADEGSGHTRYGYEAWWGFDSLPAMDAKEPQEGDAAALDGEHEWNNVDYRHHVIGDDLDGKTDEEAAEAMQNAASQRWLWMGASGWRLDVAPDVSMGTWQKFREAVKSAAGRTDANGKPIDDPVILGEEWGVATHYLLGDQFDSVMNYRFREALQTFLINGGNGGDNARAFHEALERIREDYPEEAWRAMLNLVDSHDTVRSLTKLDFPAWEEEKLKIAPEASDKALRLQALIAIFQMGYPGAPTVYYGDEVGVTGTKDPDSRRTFPWERIEEANGGYEAVGRYTELYDTYRTAAAVRAENDVFSAGDLKLAYAQGDVIAYARKTDAQGALVVLNGGEEAAEIAADVTGYLPDGTVLGDRLGSGIVGAVENGRIVLTVPALTGLMMLSEGELLQVEAPSGLTARAANGSVDLSWDGVPDADGYRVYRYLIEGGEATPLGTVADTRYTDATVVNGVKYYYAVSAVRLAAGAAGESPLSETASATPAFPITAVGAPDPVANLTVGVGNAAEIGVSVTVEGLTDDPAFAGTGAPSLDVKLVVTKAGDSEAAAELAMAYKADDGGAKRYAAKFEPTEPGVYEYFARVSTDNGETHADSASASFEAYADADDTSGPAAPSLSEITVESGQATLSWTTTGEDTAGYEVYRQAAGEVSFRKLATLRTALSFTDYTVANGTSYAYKIAAFDAAYNRSWSNEQSVTPQLVMVDVTMRLHLPDYTPSTDSIYIAGSLNNWNASGGKLTVPSGATDRSVVQYAFKMMAGKTIEYKYTRGTWATEALTSHSRIPNDTADSGNYAYSDTETNMKLTIRNQGGNKMVVDDYVLRWVDMPLIVTMPRISYGEDISYSTDAATFDLKANVPYGVAFTINGSPLPEGAMDDRGNVFVEDIPLEIGTNEFSLHIEPTAETLAKDWYKDQGRKSQATKTVALAIVRTGGDDGGNGGGGDGGNGGGDGGENGGGEDPDNGGEGPGPHPGTPPVMIVPLPDKPDDSIAKLTVETDERGNAVTVATVDGEQLAKALAGLEGGSDPLEIRLPEIEGGVRFVLPLAAAAAAPEASIRFAVADGSYVLPLSVLDPAGLAGRLGVPPEEAELAVSFGPLVGTEAERALDRVREAGLNALSAPVAYRVAAAAGGREVEIADFGFTYAERSLTLEGGVDPKRASVYRIDSATGELAFVPALFAAVDGRTVASFKRPGNSVYIAAAADRSFADLAGHWAREDAETMANKGIVLGVDAERFAPGRSITRAEFAALLVRSLGLAETDGTGGFGDVRPTDWFAGAVASAAAAELASGTADGTFRPGDGITREQMAAMLAKAADFAGRPLAEDAAADEALAAFSDGSHVGAWAREAVARAAGAGLLQGDGGGRLRPAEGATRAEAVVMLKRFLQAVEFIDK